jgi:hypothetical protein
MTRYKTFATRVREAEQLQALLGLPSTPGSWVQQLELLARYALDQPADWKHLDVLLEDEDWALLLCEQPELLKHVPKNRQLNGRAWARILRTQPQLVSQVPDWEDIRGCHLTLLLLHQPDLAVHVSNWETLIEWDWQNLLTSQAQFAVNLPYTCWQRMHQLPHSNAWENNSLAERLRNGPTWPQIAKLCPQLVPWPPAPKEQLV